MKTSHLFLFALCILWLSLGWKCEWPKTASLSEAAEDDWPAYGRNLGGTRHSPLADITRENVSQLEVAWTYRTGDISYGLRNFSTFQATPIYLWGSLYVSTGFNRVIALDPETGERRWAFDPQVDRSIKYGLGLTSRGVAAWEDPSAPEASACQRRIFLATTDARLMALDANDGQLCSDFAPASGNAVDLRAGIANVEPGNYGVTSLPVVVNGIVIVGSMVFDNRGVDVPAGVVRAFDARTGAPKWSWDPIPRSPAERGYEAWSEEDAARTKAANVWSIMTVDAERDLVFLPTSSPSPDYFGGFRKGAGPHANSVVALRASTGRFEWAFQAVHHDLWDYDIAAPPALTTVHRDGTSTDVVVVATKSGHLFVLDRDTGRSIFPIEERPVPQSDVPGEVSYPTQPFPAGMPNLTGETTLRPEDAWGYTFLEREACKLLIAGTRSEGIFTPPSLRGSIAFPSSIGGVNWGGVAIDEQRGLLITSVNRIAQVVKLIPRSELYIPLPDEEMGEQLGTPYRVSRRTLRAPVTTLPCTPPPWGKLVAVDLATGTIRWDVPIGRIPGTELLPGSDKWGSLVLGGPIVTDGGLVFIAATMDDAIRAFDRDTGKELWRRSLPAGGQATPMTYRAPNGRQFVVIAAGGSKILNRPAGDHLTAFALPN